MSKRGMQRIKRHTFKAANKAAGGRITTQIDAVAFKMAPGDGEPSGRPTFEIDAYNGGLMKPDYMYWPTPVVVDLAGLTAAEPIAVLLDHYSTQIVGQSTSVVVTTGASGKVVVSGVVTGDVDDPDDPAKKVVMHAKNGFRWRASAGIDPMRYEKVEAGATVTVNGREFSGPIYVLRAGVLAEVSLLSVSADKTTGAKIAAKAAGESDMDFHEWLKAKGFDPTKLDDAQRDTLLTAFKASQAKQVEPEKKSDDQTKGGDKLNASPPNADDSFAHIKVENARKSALKASAVKFASENPDLVDEAEKMLAVGVASQTNPEMFDLQLLRARGSRVPDNRLRSSGDSTDPETQAKVFEAALCLSGKLEHPEKHYEPRILEAAERKWRRGLGLGEFLLHAGRANGFDGLSTRDVGGLLRAAYSQHGMRAGAFPSTMDVSGILSNVANKFIVDNFNAVDSAWRSITSIRPVNDFKAIASYSLNGDFTYEKINPGGEIGHGTLGETAYSNQADTYGRMFAIDRRDIINDDLGALMQVTRRLGRGGALKLNDVFWAAFMNNSAFFTALRGNFDDGADSALDVDGLVSAELLFLNQTDPNGKPMAIMPTILLVPPALKRTAMVLMNSMEIQNTTANTIYGTANTFQGAYTIVATPYLSNALITGFSATAWYLIGPPADVATIETCFLNGVERPTVESAQADFNVLGIQMRGFFDFGVALQEYRAGVKFAGA